MIGKDISLTGVLLVVVGLAIILFALTRLWRTRKHIPRAATPAPKRSKLVLIGPDQGRFVRITADQIEYVDETGESSVLQLPPADGTPASHYVGFRWLDEAPWAVRIEGEEHVQFTFESYEAAYDLLLNPLGEAGRDTLDCT